LKGFRRGTFRLEGREKTTATNGGREKKAKGHGKRGAGAKYIREGRAVQNGGGRTDGRFHQAEEIDTLRPAIGEKGAKREFTSGT